MLLVNVGALTINFDNVAYIRDLTDRSSGLSIQFYQGYSLEIVAPEDVAAVKSWIASMSLPIPGNS